MQLMVNPVFQVYCPDKMSNKFSIWLEKLCFGQKMSNVRPLFQALICAWGNARID
jgi:hypothetical protein